MPEALVPYENIENRIRQLEEYLRNLLQINLYRNHHETVSMSHRLQMFRNKVFNRIFT